VESVGTSSHSAQAPQAAHTARTGGRKFSRRAIAPFIAAALGAPAALSSVATAHADETWCDLDPPVIITTPGGNVRIVYVTDSGPLLNVAQLLLPAISYTVHAVPGQNATDVVLSVTVPNGLLGSFSCHSYVTTGPARTGQTLSSLDGTSGTPIRHRFRLNVA
jgi:hypothetical protein